MPDSNPCRVLFTGYAPVHFLCFQPLYKRLIADPSFEVYLSGGLRSKAPNGGSTPIDKWRYDSWAMYRPLEVPPERVLLVPEIREQDFDVLFAGNTKMIEPRSVGSRVQIFHGVSFRNRAIRKENLRADHFFFVGPYMQRKFDEAGLIKGDDPRGLEIGFMKTDRLVDGSLDRGFLLKQFGFDGSRPVIVYAPTGQKKNSLQLMGEDLVRRIQAEDRFDLIVKLHDHPKFDGAAWMARMAALEDRHTVLAQSLDVIPLLFLSDVLLTDASSVSTEYTLLDRPIVFIDVPDLIQKNAEREGSMLDLTTWGRRVGRTAATPDEVAEALNRAVDNPAEESDLRTAMARDIFFNPGQATSTALEWVLNQFAPSPSAF